jgi:CheY-like chemotaxis protein
MKVVKNNIDSFGKTAATLSRSPLGIIALFLALIYGITALLAASSSLSPSERLPLIYFIIFFPLLILGVFAWIVVRHPTHWFGPSDFRNEENYVTLVAALTAAKSKERIPIDFQEIRNTASRLTSSAANRSPSRKDILWVDDHPENNRFECQAFESLGFALTLSTSTQQALKFLQDGNFAAIISDMGRKEGAEEGYVLLEAIRKQKNKTPFFIYTLDDSEERRGEAMKRNAQGLTNDAQELIQMVTAAVIRG